MSELLITVAVWQTLIDEADGFHDRVRTARIGCVQTAAAERNHDVTAEAAARALDTAADAFEQAYLTGRPMRADTRAGLIGADLGIHLSSSERHSLADALGRTHRPEWMRARPAAAETLERLADRHRIVALSDTWTSPGSVLRAALDNVGLAPYLSATYFSDETGRHKTTGSAWHTVEETHGVRPGDIVHIGDITSVDGAKALAAGCRDAIIVRHPDHPVPGASTVNGPSGITVSSLHEIPSLLERLALPNG